MVSVLLQLDDGTQVPISTTTPGATLPEISFASTNPAQIVADMIAAAESVLGRTLAPADPVRQLILAFAAVIIQERYNLDYAAKMNLLDYAQGAYLDAIGGTEVPRMDAASALTTLRFTLSAAQPGVVTIPAGTRASTGTVTFATLANANVPIGNTVIDVPSAAIVTGTAGNGYLAGQINQLIDVLPYLQSVANTTTSQGGADTESAAAYRERIRLAPTSYSVAGPIDAYIFWAKSASQSIIDVAVTSPNPREVVIYPLLTDGEIPGEEILDAVLAACNDTSRRPTTDLVTVEAPTAAEYDTTLTYYIDAADAARELEIKAAVEQAISDYHAWQRARLGRDINPSELIYRVRQAGAKRVTVAAPAYTAVSATEVATVENETITYGGLEIG